ncbi:MAG: hypothetical protein CL596_03095 [Alteromonas sp.]|nr:hypothetical protein [Alteromonas sp.]MAY22680.1 hypothetical protein [Flavobacteriaceae bacterium]|tara:strand:- start:2470 stop:2664 length:195 start_codon:yes stop_codon:yes gene_type:complete
MKKRHEQKLVILSLALLAMLNVPILLIFNFEGSMGGIPVFYVYCFGVWAISILISYIVLKRHYE